MSATYEIYSRGNEKCWLADTDTFTLALVDCADADLAENMDETTPEMLANCFSREALVALAAERGNDEKLDKAIAVAL